MLDTSQNKTAQKITHGSFFGNLPSTNDTFKETLFKQGVFTPRENILTHSLVSKQWRETVNEHIVTPIKEIDKRLRQHVLNGIYSIQDAQVLEQLWSKTRKEKITLLLSELKIYFYGDFEDKTKGFSEEQLIEFFLTPSRYVEEELAEFIENSINELLDDTVIQALFEDLFVIYPEIYDDVVPINELSAVLNYYGLEKLRVYISEGLITPEDICLLSYDKLSLILTRHNFGYNVLQAKGIDYLKEMKCNTVRRIRGIERSISNIMKLLEKTSDPVSAGDIFLHSLNEGLLEVDELGRFSPQQLEQLLLTDYGVDWLINGFNGFSIEDGFETGVYTYSEVVDFKLAERKEYYEKICLQGLTSFEAELSKTSDAETIRCNIQMAVDKNRVNFEEIKQLTSQYLEALFLNEYGLCGLRDSLFTVIEMHSLEIEKVVLLLSENGFGALDAGLTIDEAKDLNLEQLEIRINRNAVRFNC